MSKRTATFVSLLTAAVAASGLAFAADIRTYVSGNYYLTIDGVKTGFVRSTIGGGISAQVINEAASPGSFVGKHIGQPRYEPLTVSVGFSNSKAIYEWIRASWAMTDRSKNVNIDALDRDLRPKLVRAYSGCLIAETTIPALDAASKEPAYMSIKLECESMRATPGSGTAKAYGDYAKNEQKIFLPSNFKLELDGLDCSHVTKVDSFTVKRAARSDSTGQGRDSAKSAGSVEIPNLKVTLTETGATAWKQWFDDFVVRGNNDSAKEKSGTLTLFSPNRQKVLATIKFSGIGIYRMEPTPVETGSETTAKVTAELYVEKMTFDCGADVLG